MGADALPWLVRGINGCGLRAISPRPVSEPAIRQLLDSPVRKEIARRSRRAKARFGCCWNAANQQDQSAAKSIEVTLGLPGHVLGFRLWTNGTSSTDLSRSLRRGETGVLVAAAFTHRRTNGVRRCSHQADLGARAIAFPSSDDRALCALVGKGINHETLDEACSLLIGSCSCQVNDLNPGVDLLLAADWDALMKGPQAGTARALPVSADRAASAPVTVTISGNIENGTRANSPKASRLYAILGISIAGVFGVVVLISAGILLSRKK